MGCERFLPIDDIPKGAKVVLFGFGQIGKKFWKQNSILQWCDIVLIVDNCYQKYAKEIVEVEHPESILRTEYEYVLIANAFEQIRISIISQLKTMGISEERIISNVSCYWMNESCEKVLHSVVLSESSEKLKIGFVPSGAMGDNIISLKLYQELVKLAPNSDIDIFTNQEQIVRSVYWNQSNLHEIVECVLDREQMTKYDVVIDCNFEPSLLVCDFNRVESISSKLAERLHILYEYQKRDFVDLPIHSFMNRVRLERARFMGWNRYTLYGCSGAFDIKDQYVDFYINEAYKKDYESLELNKPYVTYNYGASDPLKDGKVQTKMWPYEYHELFNRLFKQRFPKIELIQVGAQNVTCVPGADRYIIGQNLEVAKYILRNSLCHVDCEGGLVHMATQLGTKCVVMFGPTPVWFFGYDRNINLAPTVCGECKGLVKDWYTRCLKYDKAECMYSITPERVLDAVEVCLDERRK